MRCAILLMAGAACLAAAPAHAAHRIYGDDPAPCTAGEASVSIDAAIDYLIGETHTFKSKQVIDAQSTGALGSLAGDNQQLFPLYYAALALVTGKSGAIPFEVTVSTSAPDNERQRATDFLNGHAPWLSLTCPSTARAGASSADAFMVRGSLEDVSKTFSTAGPASFSWTRDRDAKSEQTDVSLLIATPVIGKGTALPVRLYGAYQRNNGSEPVNDLTFGALVNQPVNLLGKWEVLTASAGWETDDRFKSSAFRGAADLAFASLCGIQKPRKAGVMCTPILSVDYFHVADAGDKPSLRGADNVFRLGASIDVTAWVPLGSAATLWVRGGYAFREDLDGGEGDAHLATASVMLSPPEDQRFSVGLEWKQGRDLSSLEHVDQVSLKLSWKQ